MCDIKKIKAKSTVIKLSALFALMLSLSVSQEEIDLQSSDVNSQFATANSTVNIADNSQSNYDTIVNNITDNSPKMLHLGGETFGIKVFSDGVMVVGISDIETTSGVTSPAKLAGVETKDIITHIDGVSVMRNEEILKILEHSNGAPIVLSIKRGTDSMEIEFTPALASDGKYKAGLWVRDSTAGLGTFTYFDPSSNKFAGLGHAICDVDTGDIIPVYEGSVVGASIFDVIKGEKGTPGQLSGVFEESYKIGTLNINSESGVFGDYYESYVPRGELIEVGHHSEVVEGPAYIVSSPENNPKYYEILITKVQKGDITNTKNMSIEVVDEELLSLTGGVVQGMSGSPIVQNGKLIGAVTHVLVNDPTRGYGIYIENMLNTQSLS